MLCGLDKLGFRILEDLNRLSECVVVVTGGESPELMSRARSLCADLVEGDFRDEVVLRSACVTQASALILSIEGDIDNVHAALIAQELNPRLRIVLRMFNQELGGKIEALFHDCSVLSASALAAPSFVSAALHEEWAQGVVVGGRTLAVREADTRAPGVLLPLTPIDGLDGEGLFPTTEGAYVCLVELDPERRVRKGQQRLQRTKIQQWPGEFLASVRDVGRRLDRRTRMMLLLLLVVVLSSMGFFAAFIEGMDPLRAAYYTVTMITTTGLGDINLLDKTGPVTLFGMALMLVGAIVLTIFYALLTDAIVSARLAKTLGGLHANMRGHVVVCGLGSIGYRVVGELAERHIPVAAVELDDSVRFITSVRRLGVPVIHADARLSETMHALNVDRARCLVACTDNDLANLEAALNARAVNPRLRIVLRLFDPDLAHRVERAFSIHISRSVSALAAPAFVAAALGRRVLAPIQAGPHLLLLATSRVEPGSWADNKTVAALEGSLEGRVMLLLRGAEQMWRPGGESVVKVGDEVVVVATRDGLAGLLDLTSVREESTAEKV